MYINESINAYLNDLGAKKPAPGGGSAAALTGAIGTSLMLMVANYTIGKPKYKDVEERVTALLAKVQKFDTEFRALIDEDVVAYERLSNSLKDVAGDEARQDELYKVAIEPPFAVCEATHQCLLLCKELVGCGNKLLITDTAIAAIALEAAFFSAKYNVYVNLKYIKDTDYIAKVHKILAPLEDEMPKLKEEIIELCEETIS